MKRLLRHYFPYSLVLALCWGGALWLLPLSANARTLEQIKALGAISMCANPDALPYSSSKDAPPGFQVEIGRKIAEGLGVQLNIDWIVPRRRAKVVNCDMLLDRPNDPTIYEGRLLLSLPYQKSSVVLGLSRGASMIYDYKELNSGQKVGVMISSAASVLLNRAHKSTTPYAFQTDMMDDLAKGELFGAAVSSPQMSYYMFQHPEAGLQQSSAFDSAVDLTWEISVGLRNADQALVDAINPVIFKLLADGTITQIYAKYGVEHRRP